MTRLNQFAIDLRESTIEEKKKFFLERTINHPILNRAYLDVTEKIKEAPSGKVFIVFGPTGVGKSTLCKRIKSDIIFNHNSNEDKNKGNIPVICLELPSPDNGKFNWRDFYRRMLQEMQEPLIESKVHSNNNGRKKRIPNHYPTTSPELRESLENAIINRNTRIVLLDEAQHLLKVASAKSIQDQMDTIKSIANLTGAIFVMFGTYELMDFFDLNGQLGRRTDEIHLRRYDIRQISDRIEFQSVINTFQNLLPLYEETNLLQYWELFYERTIGCIGILKNWLDDCLKESLNKGQTTITIDVIKKYAPSPTKALKIAQETIEGEDKLKEQAENLTLLQATLGIDVYDIESSDQSKNENTDINKRKEVGKRNPTRDEVGIKETGS